ncbi:hypothetical protein WJX73_002892 [Symbiochloris irregularis]|uniref:Uncharacterized protein n=1 Tax=Symbiochloris irregularis TaxID=706552 RepID=A0AAW1PSA7_9CHLO
MASVALYLREEVKALLSALDPSATMQASVWEHLLTRVALVTRDVLEVVVQQSAVAFFPVSKSADRG